MGRTVGKTAGKTVGTTRMRYQNEIEERLRRWGIHRGALAMKVEMANDGTKAGLLADLAELRTLEDEGRRCLAVVETAGTTSWGGMRADFIERWERVDRAVEAIWARVK